MMINATAIIQARLSSTRFPGKILRDIAGKPLIWHIIHRLKKTKHIKTIVVATSDQPSDDALVDYCQRHKLKFVRGPLDNVLMRFRIAHEAFPSDYIVRITGDSPLIDPWLLDYGLEQLSLCEADIITGDRHDYLHEGSDIMKSAFLERLLREKSDDPAAKEHVSGYLTLHPDYGNVAKMTLPKSHIFAGARISIDTPEDKTFIEALYAETGAPVGDLEIEDAVSILKAKPELVKINNFVRQKRADEKTIKILMCPEIRHGMGLGHEKRLKPLANYLKTHHSVGITYAVPKEKLDAYQADGFSTIFLENPAHKGPELCSILQSREFDAAILDIRDDTSFADLKTIKADLPNLPLILIDDGSERKKAADLAFYPLVADLETTDIKGDTYHGLDFALIPPLKEIAQPTANTLKILITMGGSDPKNVTLPLATICNELSIPFDVIIGPNFSDQEALTSSLKALQNLVNLHQNIHDITEVVGDCSAIICGYGITAYEAIMMRRPPLMICHHLGDMANAKMFERLDLGLVLGQAVSLALNDIKTSLSNLKSNADQLGTWQESAKKYSLANNISRIANLIMTTVKK